MKIELLPRENTLPKEEREKVGRWGEQPLGETGGGVSCHSQVRVPLFEDKARG